MADVTTLPAEEAVATGWRQEGVQLKRRAFRFATFTRAHIKNGVIEEIDFSHARFNDCYFRQVTFRKCDFTGAVFDRCDFPHARFVECRFPYSRWFSTQVELDQLLANLPHEWPNAARDLCNSLRMNAASLGDGRAARRLLFQGMAFHRQMLWEQVRQRHSWYQVRYGTIDKVTGGLKLLWSWIERALWGYGEKPWLVLLWGTVLTGLFAVYYSRFDLVSGASEPGVLTNGWEAFKFSALAFIGNVDPAGAHGVPTGPLAVQGALGLVFIGVLAAAVYRWISIRQV